MKINFKCKVAFKHAILFSLLTAAIPFVSQAQQLNMSEFVLYSGSGGTGCSTPSSPGYGVFLAGSSKVDKGTIGSDKLIKTTGSSTLGVSPALCNLYSKGTVVLYSSNAVTGRITAANSPTVSGTILSVGTSANLGGNIDVNGKIVIGGGTVSGIVTYPSPASNYSGPALPANRNNMNGTLSLPVFPTLPAIATFQAAGSTNISSGIITPGAYGNLTIGNNTVTLSGPGTYTFKSIKTTGPNAMIKLDFKTNTTDNFLINVHGDIVLSKTSVTLTGTGASASRIFTETHGTGSSCGDDNTTAFNMSNGSNGSGNVAGWMGTVWAPYGGIKIGAPNGPASSVTGALWSRIKVDIQTTVTINHVPFSNCNIPNANAGPDKPLSFDATTTLTGTSANSGVTFSWLAIDGGEIIPPSTAATISVTSAGTYILTVTASAGCFAKDTVIVTSKVNNIIGSELTSLYQNNLSNTGSPFFIVQPDSVVIDVIANEGKYDSVLALLQTPAYGLTQIRSNGDNLYKITGLYPISKLPLLNLLPRLINFCMPHYTPVKGLGIATTQGDAALRTNFIRNGYGLLGDSVKVGVISDSYNTIPGNPARTDIQNGDLPGIGNTLGNTIPVDSVLDYPYGIGEDEGRAMLQIVHDIAPKATLAFRTGFISPGDMAAGIRELKQHNCDVIVDDITFITEPFLKDGEVAQAVNEVSSQGVAYFSAAGNFGNKSYQSNFLPAPAPAALTGNAHDFGGNRFQPIKLKKGVYTIVLQWEDDIYSLGQTQTGGTKNDLDIYLTSNNGVTLFGYNRNNLGGDPVEILPFTVGVDSIETNILIERASGTSTNLNFKYIIFERSATSNVTIMQFNVGTSTIVGHANADSTFSIGAVRYTKTPVFGVPVPEIESFSSVGGTFIGGVMRKKPDFTAPDGVNTSVNFGSLNLEGDQLPNFFGTSAAAPHAAAAAALLIHAKRKYFREKLSVGSLREILKNSALDMNTPGRDNISGNGFIRADVAIQSFAAASPDLIRLIVPTGITPGTDTFTVAIAGNYLGDSTKVYVRGEAVKTVITTDSTGYALIPAFGAANPPIQAITSSITPSKLDGGASDTLYFFTPVKKQIKIKVVDTSIRYGEKIPAKFRSIITINDTLLQNLTHPLTPSDIGLGGDSITYTTNATSTSSVNRYNITPVIRAFDPANPKDVGLLELYKYTQPVDYDPKGILTITKMPISITPKPITETYGVILPAIEFDYDYDSTNIAVNERAAFRNNIGSQHQSEIVQKTLGFIDDASVVNNRPLTTNDIDNLGFIASGKSIVKSGKSIVKSGKSIVKNGVQLYDSTLVVGLPLATVFNYEVNDAISSLVNGKSIVKASALVNGEAVVNGKSIVAKNTAFVNGDNAGNESGSNVAAIIDSADVAAPEGDSLIFKSINLVTGFSAGNHYIVPGAFLNENFEIIYRLGNLVILPDTIFVKVRDTSIIYGAAQPAYKSDLTGFEYGETAADVISGGPAYSILNLPNPPDILPASTYTIVPAELQQISPANYIVQYQNGTLTVGKATLTISATASNKQYDRTTTAAAILTTNALPGAALTVTYTAANFNDKNVGTAKPVSITGINISGADAANYTIGNITIATATANITAVPLAVSATAAPLTVSATAVNKPYDNSTTATVTLTTNALPGDVVNATYTAANFNDKNVGIAKPVSVTGISISGADAINYSLTSTTATAAANITAIPLTVIAKDSIIAKGDPVPVNFKSTITGLLTGDNAAVTYTTNYTTSSAAGIYNIIPSVTNLNYTANITSGKLYVNPKGTGVDDVDVYLECVEDRGAAYVPANRRYVARFYSKNLNTVTVYIPIGANNKLSSSTNSFDALLQPTAFLPGNGTTKFKVPFDGNSLTWALKSYEVNTIVTESVAASKSSNKCAVSKVANTSLPVTELQAKPGIYPNPATSKVIINTPMDQIKEKELSVFDVNGKTYPVKMVRRISANSVEIDISGLRTGVYMIKLKENGKYTLARIIKL